MAARYKSVVWVVAMVMLVIAVFGWAFMAAGYAHHVEGWRTQGGAGVEDGDGRISRRGAMRRATAEAMIDFVGNAVRQVPNFGAVIGDNLRYRIWLPILFALLEGGAIAGGVAMWRFEQELKRPPRRRKPRQIATPRFRDEDP